jgi:hypothetical protein
MVVMVVKIDKIESRSFSTAEIQQFNTLTLIIGRVIITREYTYNFYVVYINYYKLAVEKNRDSIFTTVTTKFELLNLTYTYYTFVLYCKRII